MIKKIQITIDGPAGAGKSSVAKEVARRLNFTYIDTGAMYRALTYLLISNKIDLNNSKSVIKIFKSKFDYEIKDKEIFLNGENITQKIRTPEIEENIVKISHISEVRKQMRIQQRLLGKRQNLVMEGRDIGGKVLKKAKYKFYLDASIEERTRRRAMQRNNNMEEYEEIKKAIILRDEHDFSKGNMIIAKDAQIIDTTNLVMEQVVEMIIKKVEGKENV